MENYDDSYGTIHDRLSHQKPEDGSIEFIESPFFLKHYYQSKKKFEDTNRIDWEDIVENLKSAKKNQRHGTEFIFWEAVFICVGIAGTRLGAVVGRHSQNDAENLR